MKTEIKHSEFLAQGQRRLALDLRAMEMVLTPRRVIRSYGSIQPSVLPNKLSIPDLVIFQHAPNVILPHLLTTQSSQANIDVTREKNNNKSGAVCKAAGAVPKTTGSNNPKQSHKRTYRDQVK